MSKWRNSCKIWIIIIKNAVLFGYWKLKVNKFRQLSRLHFLSNSMRLWNSSLIASKLCMNVIKLPSYLLTEVFLQFPQCFFSATKLCKLKTVVLYWELIQVVSCSVSSIESFHWTLDCLGAPNGQSLNPTTSSFSTTIAFMR